MTRECQLGAVLTSSAATELHCGHDRFWDVTQPSFCTSEEYGELALHKIALVFLARKSHVGVQMFR
jgi:hypothetical protein